MHYNDDYLEDLSLAVSAVPEINKLYHKTILITGGTGMICSAAAEILFYINKKYDAGIRIILAGRDSSRAQERFPDMEEGRDYRFLHFDASKYQEIDCKADYIIHGAGYGDPRSIKSDPDNVITANLTGLRSMLDLAEKNDDCRLLFISSSEVYGRSESSGGYREDGYGYIDILNPRSCYPEAKRACETLCAAYRDKYGSDFVVVRPGHIYGPTITGSDSRASAQFSRKAKAKENIVMKSAGTQLRSYCYTLDCASALLTVLIKGKSGEAYNISNHASIVTIRELAQEFADQAGVEVVFENASDTEKASYNMMDNSSLDSEKIEALGWEAKFDLKAGVAKTLEFL